MRYLQNLLLAGIFSFVSASAVGENGSADALRQEFRTAYEAVARTPPGSVRNDSEGLRRYPLYPYLQSARIRRDLVGIGSVAARAEIQAASFMAEYSDQPVGQQLRRAWLMTLAQGQRWHAFVDHYRPGIANPTLRCHLLTAYGYLGRTAELADAVKEQWLTAQQLPHVCEPAFASARQSGVLTPDLIEQRVQLLLQRGNARFARIIARHLPPKRAQPWLQWANLIQQPRQEMDRLLADPQRPVKPEALLAGWTRLARTDRDAALMRYQALVDRLALDESQASPLALALALALAWDRRAESVEYFAKVRPADMTDDAREWLARAALWQGNWKLVREAIESMTPSRREKSAWQYWLARAWEDAGEREKALTLYEAVMPADNFYSAMAAARVERKIAPRQNPLPVDRVELGRIAALPPFVRARELKVLGWDAEALLEWRHGYNELTEPSQRQTIHLANQWRWFDLAVATATSHGIYDDYELLYPQPYDNEIKAATKLTGVRSELLYGVLRQESLYRADAVSAAGARGLLQILPGTARIAARKWELSAPRPSDLLSPAINVKLGAAYLRSLLDRFDAQVPVALAGYNAGPNAAARWLPSDPIDVDRWVETIPYNETRAYVRRVLWHSVVFGWLRTQQPQDTAHWVSQIRDPRILLGQAEE